MDGNASAAMMALAKAGGKGLSRTELVKLLPGSAAEKTAALRRLVDAGDIRGPFKVGRSEYFFDESLAPTPEKLASEIEDQLRGASMRATSRAALQRKMTGWRGKLFRDAIGVLKAEGRIVELKNGNSILYFHPEPILEQLQVADRYYDRASKLGSGARSPLTWQDVRQAYRDLKAQQGGINTVTVYDLQQKLGVPKADLHKLLLREAKQGRASLHPSSTVNFGREIIDAGISVPGEPRPLVTVVVRDAS